MATTESSAFRATTTTPVPDGPRFRVRFCVDGQEHDAHAAFIARADAESFRAALMESLDVTSAHVLEPCRQCGEHSAHLDGVDGELQCSGCASQPLTSPKPWSVDPAYTAIVKSESCERCGVYFLLGDEGIHTHDDAPLCFGCLDDGIPRRTWERIRAERTA